MDIETLIREVYKKTAIWSKREKSHSNRHIIDKYWKEISRAMNVDENLLRKKWKYLRDQYAVELGKIPPLRSGDAPNKIRTSRWSYFHSLSFLKDTVKVRLPKANCSKKLPDKQTTTVKTEVGLSDDEYVDLTAGDHGVVEQPTGRGKTSDENERKMRKRKLPQTDTYNAKMLNIEKQKLEFLKKIAVTRERRNVEDEDLFFFKSLLPHVKRIPSSSKLAFRGRIQEVVNEFAYAKRPVSDSPFTLIFPTSPDIPPLS